MGTRLYIKTDNATLETILGVPAGTWAKTEEICAAIAGHGDEAYEQREAELAKHEGAGRCYDFDLFGFGKLNSDQWEFLRTVIPDEDDLWCGSSEDPAVISKLLLLCGREGALKAWRNRAKITKVSWS